MNYQAWQRTLFLQCDGAPPPIHLNLADLFVKRLFIRSFYESSTSHIASSYGITAHLHQPWIERLQEVNRHATEHGFLQWENKRTILLGYSYPTLYDWDCWFEGLFWSHTGVSRYLRANTEAFLDAQRSNGYISRTLCGDKPQHFKPFLAQMALLAWRIDGRDAWLTPKVMRRLENYLDHWHWFHDHDKNGLSVWDSGDHSGMDNHDRRCGGFSVERFEGVDLNCYLVRDHQAMACLYDILEQPQKSQEHRLAAEQLTEHINAYLWDEERVFIAIEMNVRAV